MPRRRCKEALEMGGHEVEVAHDGQEGVAKARTLKPMSSCATSVCLA